MLVSAIGKLNTFHRGYIKPQNTFGAECSTGKKNVKYGKKTETCQKISLKH